MSYIDRNLLPSETIVFRTRKSIIIFLVPFILTLLALFVSPYMLSNPLLEKLTFAPWIVVFIFWAVNLIDYFSSEYAVTDKRIMMREGFFTRHANEMRLTAISQVNVEQSLIGVMLNYGTVSINAFGAFDAYPLISSPFRFQKTVNQQLDLLVSK